METPMTSLTPEQSARPERKRWEEPAIVLERSLEVAAQGRPLYNKSNGALYGFVGPLLGQDESCSGGGLN